MSSNSRQHAGEVIGDVKKCVDNAIQRSIICCPNCEHFDRKAEVCNYNNRQRPPANIIAFGCNWFKIDDVPF